jgi:ABC-type sugar transport system substrate-binding protein
MTETSPVRTIVLSLPDLENEFQVLQVREAHETAARLGLELEVLSAEGSPVLQVNQLVKAMRANPGPKAIVVEPITPEGMQKVAGRITSAGIGLAVLNCTMPGLEALRQQRPDLPVFTVCSDQSEIGRAQGDQIRTLLPDGGHVLYIHGPQGSTAAAERLQGTDAVLRGSGIDRIDLDGRWSESSATRVVRGWLRLKSSESVPLDLVAAQDDSMARGARLALEEAGAFSRWPQLKFLGIDGVPDVGQRLVDIRQLTATIVMPSNTGPALEALARWLASGTVPVSHRLAVRSYPTTTELARQALRKQRRA